MHQYKFHIWDYYVIKKNPPSISDPHLLSVDNPIIALLHCLSLHSTHIAASARLSHTIGTHQGLLQRCEFDKISQKVSSHLNQPAQVLLLLLMVASDHNRHGSKSIGLNGSHDASATVGHLLSDQTTILVGNDVKIGFMLKKSRLKRPEVNSPEFQGPCHRTPEKHVSIQIRVQWLD